MASTYVHHPVDWYDYQDGMLATVETRYSGTDPSFNALLVRLVRKADPNNLAKIEAAFPEKVACIKARYLAQGGLLDGDPEDARREVYAR